MAIFLLKLVFFTMSALSNLITRVLFTVVAHVFVQIIQVFKVPGESARQAIETIRGTIEACLEKLLEFLVEVITTILSFVFDLVKEGLTSSSVATVSAVGGLVEKTRTSLDGLVKDVPEVIEGFIEMITAILTDLWNNYKDALDYVTQNA